MHSQSIFACDRGSYCGNCVSCERSAGNSGSFSDNNFFGTLWFFILNDYENGRVLSFTFVNIFPYCNDYWDRYCLQGSFLPAWNAISWSFPQVNKQKSQGNMENVILDIFIDRKYL